MSWSVLVAERRVVEEAPSRTELEDLRRRAEAALADAALPGLSPAGRFQLAYHGARLHAVRAIRACGYRVRGHGGAHYNTFRAVRVALGPSTEDLSSYLDVCREKRNLLAYDTGHEVTETEAHELIGCARVLANLIDASLRARRPTRE